MVAGLARAALLAAAQAAAALPPGLPRASADAIVALALPGPHPGWRSSETAGPEGRTIVAIDDAADGRAATLLLDRDGSVSRLAINSPSGRPFADRAALAAAVPRLLEPAIAEGEARWAASAILQCWRLNSHAGIKVGGFAVHGFRAGGGTHLHDHLAIDRL